MKGIIPVLLFAVNFVASSPVDNTWSSWSACSSACGEGVQTREKICIQGNDCQGEKEVRDCWGQNEDCLVENIELQDDNIDAENLPRCGNSDEQPIIDLDRFALLGSKWNAKLTYFRNNMCTNCSINESEVDNELELAAAMWSNVSCLTIAKAKPGEEVDINIWFNAGVHNNDGFPFDGPGKVLAHTFNPPSKGDKWPLFGDIHFDDDEHWKPMDEFSNRNFLHVAVHELGHALGLGHSNDSKAIMYPSVNYVHGRDVALHEDDVEGIRAIYGDCGTKPTTSSTTTPTTTTTTTSTTKPADCFHVDRYYLGKKIGEAEGGADSASDCQRMCQQYDEEPKCEFWNWTNDNSNKCEFMIKEMWHFIFVKKNVVYGPAFC